MVFFTDVVVGTKVPQTGSCFNSPPVSPLAAWPGWRWAGGFAAVEKKRATLVMRYRMIAKMISRTMKRKKSRNIGKTGFGAYPWAIKPSCDTRCDQNSRCTTSGNAGPPAALFLLALLRVLGRGVL